MKRLVIVGLIAFLLMTGVFGVLGQEATAVVTAEPTLPPPVIVIPDVPAPGEIVTDVGTIIFYLLAAFGVGGLAGIAGFGVLAGRLLNNKDALDAMERLVTNTIPLDALKIINDVATSAQKLTELVAVITDRLPNVIVTLPSEPPADDR